MTAMQGWLQTVGTLLDAAHRRAKARMRAQSHREQSLSPGVLFGFSLFASLVFHCLIAFAFLTIGGTSQELADDAHGALVVDDYVIDGMAYFEYVEAELRALEGEFRARGLMDSADYQSRYAQQQQRVDEAREGLDVSLRIQAQTKARRLGGTVEQWRERLAQTFASQGRAGFSARGSTTLFSDPVAYSAVALLIAAWWLSLVLQGEGFEFDTSRRRHPVWEWYFRFPIRHSAVFTAEALTPVLMNPFLLAAPVMIAVLVGGHTGSKVAGFLALPLGIPLVLTAAIWAKALEVLIMLRSPVRSRGVWFVLMSIAGFVAMFAPMLLTQSPSVVRGLAHVASELSGPLQSVRYVLDIRTPAEWLRAAVVCTAIAAVLGLPAYWVMRFAVARGLESGFGDESATRRQGKFQAYDATRTRWLTDPLLQKEWLWLKRDRGALIQLIVMPLFLIGFQLFNLRNLIRDAELSWNKLAAFVVGLGAYMLFVSGPRALLSEGPALTLTMSWPRSIEDMLRMKVRLLFALASVMVWISLAVLIWMFPADAWKLTLVALAWPLFGLSIAEKAVTLIRAPSQGNEPEPVSKGQLWAASIGNFAFAIALFTAQWQLAIAAIALNWIFAGALWQGFRHRLAYLFDPQSEPELRPPTILSSLVAIVALLEFGAILSIPFILALGADAAWYARTMAYGIAAAGVCWVTWRWHNKQGVSLRDVFVLSESAHLVPVRASLLAVVAGVALGFIGVGYQELLHHLPWPAVREALQRTSELLSQSPNATIAYATMAVGIAPWVEEFLFRGLMFRAMLPQWGLPLATLVSSAFFAILHPALAWPMVFSVGVLNAYLFYQARSLLPCMLLHLSYNAIIVGFMR